MVLEITAFGREISIGGIFDGYVARFNLTLDKVPTIYVDEPNALAKSHNCFDYDDFGNSIHELIRRYVKNISLRYILHVEKANDRYIQMIAVLDVYDSFTSNRNRVGIIYDMFDSTFDLDLGRAARELGDIRDRLSRGYTHLVLTRGPADYYDVVAHPNVVVRTVDGFEARIVTLLGRRCPAYCLLDEKPSDKFAVFVRHTENRCPMYSFYYDAARDEFF